MNSKNIKLEIELVFPFIIVMTALCHSINIIAKERIMLFMIAMVSLMLILGIVTSRKKERTIDIYGIDAVWLLWLIIFAVNRDENYNKFYTMFFLVWLLMRLWE